MQIQPPIEPIEQQYIDDLKLSKKLRKLQPKHYICTNGEYGSLCRACLGKKMRPITL